MFKRVGIFIPYVDITNHMQIWEKIRQFCILTETSRSYEGDAANILRVKIQKKKAFLIKPLFPNFYSLYVKNLPSFSFIKEESFWSLDNPC